MNIGGYELKRYVLPLMDSNMFMLTAGKNALVIDPNRDIEAFGLLKSAGIKDITAILTHEHFDHISGVQMLREIAGTWPGTCRVYANSFCAAAIKDPDANLSRFFRALFINRSEEERAKAEKIFDTEYSCSADVSFEKDMRFMWEDISIRLFTTPGHSPGSLCAELYDSTGKLLALATGDSLVEGNKVITRLPGGSRKDYDEITRPYLEHFSVDTLVLPGHGEVSLMKDLELG
ncbi:MAG: MBL fold metallo-hydrolase [Lachnospiraceae bacterium]|nr:MBL fold metallo-hydrolase [Lachnospiraceae bacterium]